MIKHWLKSYFYSGRDDMLTNKKKLMTDQFQHAIYRKYNILDHFEFKEFDADWLNFESHLRSIRKDVYEHNDRYIIEHQDTDYYIEQTFPYGIGLYNLINMFKNLDIPLHTMLLFTNHFGISAEINRLAPDVNDRPTVIETFITNTHYSSNYIEPEINSDAIEYPAICLIGGTRRVHRFALFRFFEQHHLLNTVPTSI